MVPAAGVEPATFRSGGERSNPLSYAGTGQTENDNIARRPSSSARVICFVWRGLLLRFKSYITRAHVREILTSRRTAARGS